MAYSKPIIPYGGNVCIIRFQFLGELWFIYTIS